VTTLGTLLNCAIFQVWNIIFTQAHFLQLYFTAHPFMSIQYDLQWRSELFFHVFTVLRLRYVLATASNDYHTLL
jgi:hypothetical protein